MPTAPKRPCRAPSCPELTDTGWCDDHRPEPFVGSARRHTLPANWPALRRAVLRRAKGRCERCGDHATDVDHILAAHLGGSDSLSNLQALCDPCHKAKSAREANAARRAKEQR